MRSFFTCLLLCLISALASLSAQTPKDYTVPLSATVTTATPSVTLNWPNPFASNVNIQRRTKGESGSQWIQILSAQNSPLTTLTDPNVVFGQTYEYQIERISNVSSYGYVHAAIEAPVTDSRGKLLLFTEEALAASLLSVEINRLKDDLRGDGWTVVEHLVPVSATVQTVKSQIVADYAADPNKVKAVLLLGSIPVPYSGNTQWDGHPEHAGAWPADSYYADVNGTWTDAAINNLTPARTANDNIPGDGKFDQSFIPSPVELQVGRVDFRHIDAVAFGAANTIELYRRYLNKNHDWRSGLYKTEKKALVDDNFGVLGGSGETFAANGYRNAYPLVGEANVSATDFFNNTNPQRWLLGYGTGGGTYTSAGGVGSSSDFAVDTVHIVFSNLFGSYHGDWDYESNPFMPSALASRGGILTCSWAGRPHHFYQALASGETIGFCTKETMNAPYNDGFQPTLGEGGAHIALLGDPTLRAHVVAPAEGVTAQLSSCNVVSVSWKASPDSAVAGYHIYRAMSLEGPYMRLTPDALAGTIYSDVSPPQGTLHYSVRAVKRETSPGGGIYWNNSTGTVPVSVAYTATGVPQVTATGNTITCAQLSAPLASSSDIAGSTFLWTGPNNFTSQIPNPTVTIPGTYALLVTTPNSCTTTATVAVLIDTIRPELKIPRQFTYNCKNPCASFTFSALPNLAYSLDNEPATSPLTFCNAGQYLLTLDNTLNGCSTEYPLEVISDVNEPGALAGFSGGGLVNCVPAPVQLASNSPTAGAIYRWSGPNGFTSNLQNPSPVNTPGTYTLTVTNPANGCTSTDEVTILYDPATPPTVTIPPTLINCTTTSIQICAEVTPPNVMFMWTGPNGFTSSQKCINSSFQLPGNYTVVVTALSSGCTASATTNFILDITLPDISITPPQILTCITKSVEICAQSSTPGVTFAWLGAGGFVSVQQCPTITMPGNYTCIATAPNGCTATANAVVLQDVSLPTITITNLEKLDCNTPCITVEGTIQNVVITPITVCTPGVYSTIATGLSNGCTTTVSFAVTQAPPLEVLVKPVVVNCVSAGTIIETVPSGGTPPYNYIWTTGDTTPVITLTLGGVIGFTVTDAGGCTFSQSVTILVPPPVIVEANVVNESAPGAKDGKASVFAVGGTGLFVYLWSNGQTTPTITGLSAGNYTCTITEVTTGCTAVVVAQVQTTVSTDESGWLTELSLAPNPTEGQSRLTLRLTEPSPIRLVVHDAAGRLIWQQNVLETNLLNQTIDLHNQPNGMYWITVQANGKSAVRKLVLVRE